MNQPASHSYNAGFMVNHGRRAKADKIMQVLDEALGQRTKPSLKRLLPLTSAPAMVKSPAI